ncbi:MAG: hypothetical protein JWO57_2320 [Pseudonocardiales bacterium]|nr:hypothetical protein [Pseudonocardiales bacterium]
MTHEPAQLVALVAPLAVPGGAGSCAPGLITGIGGGVSRDILLRRIPLVLPRGEVYAIVAFGEGGGGVRPACGARRSGHAKATPLGW